jgi:hypothetical protein
MLRKLLLVPVYLVLLIKDTLITILHSDFTYTLVVSGSCLALLSLATGEPLVAYLSVAFLTMFLIPAMVYLITMMKTYGLLVEVEASVDVGVVFGVMVWTLLTVLSLLALSHSCT